MTYIALVVLGAIAVAGWRGARLLRELDELENLSSGDRGAPPRSDGDGVRRSTRRPRLRLVRGEGPDAG